MRVSDFEHGAFVWSLTRTGPVAQGLEKRSHLHAEARRGVCQPRFRAQRLAAQRSGPHREGQSMGKARGVPCGFKEGNFFLVSKLLTELHYLKISYSLYSCI